MEERSNRKFIAELLFPIKWIRQLQSLLKLKKHTLYMVNVLNILRNSRLMMRTTKLESVIELKLWKLVHCQQLNVSA